MLRKSGFEHGYEAENANFKFPETDRTAKLESAEVIEFPNTEKPAEHVVKHIFDKLSPHQKSLEILKEAGYDSLAEATLAQATLKEKKDELAMSFGAKAKDRIFNQGKKVKELVALEKELTVLSRKLRVAKIAAGREDAQDTSYGDNVIHMPENVWPGHGKEIDESALVEAQKKLDELNTQKRLILNGSKQMGFSKQARAYNRSMNIKNLPDINSQIKELEKYVDSFEKPAADDSQEVGKAA